MLTFKMLNCQINFKKPFPVYIFIFALYLNNSICSFCDEINFLDLKKEKTTAIEPEEIIRRRNITESYLQSRDNVEKNWIETYHETFSGSYNLRHKTKIEQKSSVSQDGQVVQIFHDEIRQSGEMPNDEPILTRDVYHRIPEKTFETRNDDIKNHFMINSGNKQNINSHDTVEPCYKEPYNLKSNQKSFESSNFLVNAKAVPGCNVENQFMVKSEIIGECVPHFSSRCLNDKKDGNEFLHFNNKKIEVNTDRNLKYSKTRTNIEQSSPIKNNSLKANEIKILSSKKEKIDKIITKHSNFKDYFVNVDMELLTEFSKLEGSFIKDPGLTLERSKNNVYFNNCMKKAYSVCTAKPLFIIKEFYTGEMKMCKLPDTKNDVFLKKLSEATHIEKGMLLQRNLKNTNVNHILVDSKLLRRKKLINSFLTTLHHEQKNWIETYHFNNLEHKSKKYYSYSKSLTNNAELENKFMFLNDDLRTKENSKEYVQEQYIIRWINKMRNKLKNFDEENNRLSISFSIDLLSDLEKLSKDFDIVMLDELIDRIISNATQHENYRNTLYNIYASIFSVNYFSQNSTVIYVVIFSVAFIFLCCQYYKFFPSIVLVFILIISWHGYKMYQQKIAAKHTILSRVVPSYCENILNQESGILAHLKEYVRHLWYDADCKKYYEALMIDAAAEISLPVIIVDLLSDIMFQPLPSFGHAINMLYRELIYGIPIYYQIPVIIILMVFIVAILFFCLSLLSRHLNYKIHFPFFLGSVEPIAFPKGSSVEDIEFKKQNYPVQNSYTKYVSVVNYNIQSKSKNCNEFLSKETLKEELKNLNIKSSRDSISSTWKILARRKSI